MNVAATQFLTIPLTHLEISPKNMRKTDAECVDDLLASIPVHGLIQSLAVEPSGKKDRYLVIAGGRRLKALKILAKEKAIAKDYPIPCRVVDSEAEAISLAENHNRVPPHPADQYDAFAAQIATGKSIEEVSNAYGVSETIVKKRMKLAAVAPEILAAYRAGDIELEQVAAYAVSDDHERQRAVFTGNPNARSHNIRTALTEGEVTASDSRVKLVGLDVYVAAGGAVRQDLFAEGDNGLYLIDTALLDRLAAEKINAIIEDVKAEGWQDVFLFDGAVWELQQTYKGRVYPQRVLLTEEQEAEREKVAEQLEAVSNQLEGDEDNAELLAEYDRLEEALDTFNVEAYSAEDKARAVVAITRDYNGNLRIERGLMKKADRDSNTGTTSAAPQLDAEGLPQVGNTLAVELAAVRCAAIAADLTTNGQKALAVTVHTMATDLLLGYSNLKSPCDLRISNSRVASSISHKDMRPLETLATALKSVREALPENPRDWLAHLLALDTGALLDMLAVLVAHSVNPFGQFAETFAKIAADDLAASMDTQAAQWVALSDLDYLARIPKAQILAVIGKVCGRDKAENLSKLKKAELVERATELLDGKWLPSQLSALASEAARDNAKARFSEVFRDGIDDDDDDDFGGNDDEAGDDEDMGMSEE